jgi:hypothetical protein
MLMSDFGIRYMVTLDLLNKTKDCSMTLRGSALRRRMGSDADTRSRERPSTLYRNVLEDVRSLDGLMTVLVGVGVEATVAVVGVGIEATVAVVGVVGAYEEEEGGSEGW